MTLLEINQYDTIAQKDKAITDKNESKSKPSNRMYWYKINIIL